MQSAGKDIPHSRARLAAFLRPMAPAMALRAWSPRRRGRSRRSGERFEDQPSPLSCLNRTKKAATPIAPPRIAAARMRVRAEAPAPIPDRSAPTPIPISITFEAVSASEPNPPTTFWNGRANASCQAMKAREHGQGDVEDPGEGVGRGRAERLSEMNAQMSAPHSAPRRRDGDLHHVVLATCHREGPTEVAR